MRFLPELHGTAPQTMASEDSPKRQLDAPEPGSLRVPGFEAHIETSILKLSNEVRELRRNGEQVKIELAAVQKGATSTSPAGSSPRFPVILLCVLIVVLIGGLGFVMQQSHADFAKGIAIAESGARSGQNSSAMTRRIFLLACGNQILTFKTAAFVISALMFFVGAVFVLLKTDAPYALSTEGSGLKTSLSTSSPGLVIVTLAVALAIATLYAKSSVEDQPDTDLVAPAASAAGKPAAPNPEAEFERALELYRLHGATTAVSSNPYQPQAKQ